MHFPLQHTLLLLLTVLGLGVHSGATTVEAVSTRSEPASAILYLFAHQDDEVFVLGRMRRDVLEGREVHALWTTDGALGGKPAAREQESRAVMALIGVPTANLHFLHFPDHSSYHHLSALADLVMALARSRPFAEIVSPAYEGGNIDHDTAAFLGAFAARVTTTNAIHREFPLYNNFNHHERYGVFLPNADSPITFEQLDPGCRMIVSDALKLYRSQRVLLTVLAIIGHKKTILARGEPFRVTPSYDYLRRPVAGTCGYEVSGLHRAKFADWLAAIEPFLRNHPELEAKPESQPVALDRPTPDPAFLFPATALADSRSFRHRSPVVR